MNELILIVGLHLDDHVHCTLWIHACGVTFSFIDLMQAAFKDNNLVVSPLNTLVHGFVLVKVLYGGNLSKIH